jgi:hypothetical protein
MNTKQPKITFPRWTQFSREEKVQIIEENGGEIPVHFKATIPDDLLQDELALETINLYTLNLLLQPVLHVTSLKSRL